MVHTRPYYDRRCKNKRLTNIESLPDDLLFHILLRLPSQDIYVAARHVCRKWHSMIHTHDFTHAHLQHVRYGLVFHCLVTDELTYFVALHQGKIEISSFAREPGFPFWTSCNGLLLKYGSQGADCLDVVNLATNQRFVLPPFDRTIQDTNFCSLAYVVASMEYKVVVAFLNLSNFCYECAVLTIGEDTWRKVGADHLSPTARKLLRKPSLVTEGFLHWFDSQGGTQVLTMNVETEVITETPPPIPQDNGIYKFLSTGRYLSLLIPCRKFTWQVWVMKPETGEWRKLVDIDLEAQGCKFRRFGLKHRDHLVPVGWLKCLEVLVFAMSGADRIFVSYNLCTHEIDLIELPPYRLAGSRPPSSKLYRVLVHKNGLEWLGGRKI